MNKISIKCTSRKDKEIINILTSLGGNNPRHYSGNCINLYYFINNENNIAADSRPPKGYISCTLKEYKQKFNNMEKRTIQIDLITAKEWYKQGGDLRKVALQAFTENELNYLPKSWEEYCKINSYLDKDKAVFLLADGNINPLPSSYCARINLPGAVPSKKRAEQFLTLNKLLQIRDYYNQGWKPDWNDVRQEKFIIGAEYNKLFTEVFHNLMFMFAFKTGEIRNEFFNNFKPELEFIKEFL